MIGNGYLVSGEVFSASAGGYIFQFQWVGSDWSPRVSPLMALENTDDCLSNNIVLNELVYCGDESPRRRAYFIDWLYDACADTSRVPPQLRAGVRRYKSVLERDKDGTSKERRDSFDALYAAWIERKQSGLLGALWSMVRVVRDAVGALNDGGPSIPNGRFNQFIDRLAAEPGMRIPLRLQAAVAEHRQTRNVCRGLVDEVLYTDSTLTKGQAEAKAQSDDCAGAFKRDKRACSELRQSWVQYHRHTDAGWLVSAIRGTGRFLRRLFPAST